MGPQGEKIIESCYEIYSKNHDVSFEQFIEDVVMNDDNRELFDSLFEYAKSIYPLKKLNDCNIDIKTILEILDKYQVECQLKWNTGTVPDAREWFSNNYRYEKKIKI